tara:strand:+ start:1387 stop:1995 length:609 start_codon:yes stop_codon:yes gene_type:complete
MKLIIESWRSYGRVVEQEYKDCPTNNIKLSNIALSLLGTIQDDELRAAEIDKLEKQLNSPLKEKLESLEELTGVLVAAGAIFAPATGGGSIAIAGLVGATATLISSLLQRSSAKKIDTGKKEIRQLLNIFCIDDETLDLISNEYEAKYYNESGIFDEIKRLVHQALQGNDMEVPDLTKHLVDWINNNTEYKNSDASSIEMKR